jgi:hypothetical protein
MVLVAGIFLLDSKFENHIDTERQCIGDGLVTAGIDDVLQTRLHQLPSLSKEVGANLQEGQSRHPAAATTLFHSWRFKQQLENQADSDKR